MKINIFILIFLLSFISQARDITVISIDTGIDTSHQDINKHLINKNEDDNNDINGHGTHIAGLIIKDTCPEVKLISCKYHYENWESKKKTFLDCFAKAVEFKVDYINFSSGGKGYDQIEKDLIQAALDNGSIMVTSAGNDNKKNPKYYPAAYNLPGMIIIGNLDNNGLKHETSNYGFKDMKWEIGTEVYSTLPNGKFGYMTGTSQATAIYMNKLLKQRCLKLK